MGDRGGEQARRRDWEQSYKNARVHTLTSL